MIFCTYRDADVEGMSLIRCYKPAKALSYFRMNGGITYSANCEDHHQYSVLNAFSMGAYPLMARKIILEEHYFSILEDIVEKQPEHQHWDSVLEEVIRGVS